MEGKPLSEIVVQFTSPELVPHGYIDENLSKYTGAEQLPELHSSASNLLSQLDHHSQEITWQLETAIGELVRSTSRLEYEVELLKSDVDGLEVDIQDSTRPKFNNLVESGNNLNEASLEKLRKLDRVKANMQKVKQVFEQAKSFDETAIGQEIMTMVNNGKTDSALSKLGYWESLCIVWKGTAMYNGRINFVKGLRKRVQAVITSAEDDERSRSSMEEFPSRPDSANSDVNKSYYGLIGQIQRKIF
jgi:hypothetical protein